MYLARRFPHCQLWWPVAGEHISVNGLAQTPSKSVLLEIKTADWSSNQHQHRLTLDVDQLRGYRASTVPVYYVLPVPPWAGVLNDANPWLTGSVRSHLSEAGAGRFTEWTFVVSARTLLTWVAGRNRSGLGLTLRIRDDDAEEGEAPMHVPAYEQDLYHPVAHRDVDSALPSDPHVRSTALLQIPVRDLDV